MKLRPGARKTWLALHLAVSVGWIGGAGVYLALVLRAMAEPGPALVRSTWAALNLIGWWVLVPMALVSVSSGVVLALGTRWGLLRHYWVVISLVLTVLAAAVLLAHMGTVSAQAAAAEAGLAEPAGLPSELLHAGLGLVVLLFVHSLNIFKPRGLTPIGWRAKNLDR